MNLNIEQNKLSKINTGKKKDLITKQKNQWDTGQYHWSYTHEIGVPGGEEGNRIFETIMVKKLQTLINFKL